MNTLLLDALHSNNKARAPIWLMRQAGRYMPKYRDYRKKYSFLELCHTPDIAASITLLPIDLIGTDAAILFSDILTVPEAFGVGLHFEDTLGPIIERPLSPAKDVANLPKVNANESLKFVSDTIRLLKPNLKVPLIGFSGAPFTLASYMIEGKTSKNFKKTKQWMLNDSISFQLLLDKITDVTIDYLNMQIDAGVDALQIFDSWANTLAHAQFRHYSLASIKKIVDSIKHRNVPIIVFCKGSSVFAKDLAELNTAAISIDSSANIACIRKSIPTSIALQGNLDPDFLYAPKQVLLNEAKKILDSMQGEPGYIFNLGHGVLPDVSQDNVKALVDFVKCYEYRP